MKSKNNNITKCRRHNVLLRFFIFFITRRCQSNAIECRLMSESIKFNRMPIIRLLFDCFRQLNGNQIFFLINSINSTTNHYLIVFDYHTIEFDCTVRLTSMSVQTFWGMLKTFFPPFLICALEVLLDQGC